VDLAEAKAALERRLAELEREIELLKLALSLIEELSGAEPAGAERAEPPTQPEAEAGGVEARGGREAPAARERRGLETFLPEKAKKAEKKAKAGGEDLGRRLSEEVLKSREGRALAKLAVYEKGLVVEPLVEVPSDSPPFLKFLVMKVLNEYRKADERAARYGDIEPGEKLDYAVEEDGEGRVQRVIVWNWRERRRLEDIKSAAKWALARVLERSEAAGQRANAKP
jgi:hypothetical protein